MNSLRLVICGIFISTAVDCENSQIQIIETKPSKLLIKEGESANISCTSDQPWFFCLWQHPSGTKKCSLKEDGQYRSVCLGMENMSVHGNGNTCQLNMKNITVDDHGVYMCLLNQAELFHTDRAYVNVEVATPAKLEMKRMGEMEESSTLDLMEGETVQMECAGKEAYPAPSFLWNLPGQEGVRGNEVRMQEFPSHTINSKSFINYTADSAHSGLNISCLTLQTDGNDVLYSSMVVMTLHVSRAVPLHSNEESKVVLTGIFMGGLIMIICLGVILVFIMRRKKNVVSTNEEKCEDQLSPIRSIHKNNGNVNCILEKEGLYSKPCITSTPYRKEEAYCCRVDVHNSSASSNSNFNSSMSEASSIENNLDRTQSIGDIVEGNFVSFSRSDMYCQSSSYVSMCDDGAHRAYITMQEEEVSEIQHISTDGEQSQNQQETSCCKENCTKSSDISLNFTLLVPDSQREITAKENEEVSNHYPQNSLETDRENDFHIQDSSSLSYIIVNSDKEEEINQMSVNMIDIDPISSTKEPYVSVSVYDETAQECDSELLSESINEKHLVHNSISDQTVNISLQDFDHIN